MRKMPACNFEPKRNAVTVITEVRYRKKTLKYSALPT